MRRRHTAVGVVALLIAGGVAVAGRGAVLGPALLVRTQLTRARCAHGTSSLRTIMGASARSPKRWSRWCNWGSKVA